MVPTPKLPMSVFTDWLAVGERGLSSEAIVSHLTGTRVGRWSHRDYPHDPDDFRRCELLLRAVPLARLTFPSMAEVSPQWARLVAGWGDIANLCAEEAPGYLDNHQGSAPRAYRLMRRLIDDGVECATCLGEGVGLDCEKCKGRGRRGGGRCRARFCYRGRVLCDDCRGVGHHQKVPA